MVDSVGALPAVSSGAAAGSVANIRNRHGLDPPLRSHRDRRGTRVRRPNSANASVRDSSGNEAQRLVEYDAVVSVMPRFADGRLRARCPSPRRDGRLHGHVDRTCGVGRARPSSASSMISVSVSSENVVSTLATHARSKAGASGSASMTSSHLGDEGRIRIAMSAAGSSADRSRSRVSDGAATDSMRHRLHGRDLSRFRFRHRGLPRLRRLPVQASTVYSVTVAGAATATSPALAMSSQHRSRGPRRRSCTDDGRRRSRGPGESRSRRRMP